MLKLLYIYNKGSGFNQYYKLIRKNMNSEMQKTCFCELLKCAIIETGFMRKFLKFMLKIFF